MAYNDVFAVIADKTRRAILTALKDGERPVGDLVAELGVAQPTVSKHLKILREAGMVSMEARGQRRLYAVRAEPLAEVVDWVHEVVGGAARGAGAAEGPPSPAGAGAAGEGAAGQGATGESAAGISAGGIPAADPAAATDDEEVAVPGPEAAAGPGPETGDATGAGDLPAETTAAGPPRGTPGRAGDGPAVPSPVEPGPGAPPGVPPARPDTAPARPQDRPASGARTGGLFAGLSSLRRRTRRPRR